MNKYSVPEREVRKLFGLEGSHEREEGVESDDIG